MRIGHGYDVHRLAKDRRLVLGGVNIPYPQGLLGHSDADVLLHAVIDALLGAAGEGDIGQHFPDNSNAFKDISSLILLKKTGEIIKKKGYRVNNIDATVIAQAPKISSYIPKMTELISTTLGIETSSVNIKGTTTEGLGYIGRGEGIAAHAVATIKTEDG
ncbi:MAG: 2-C-methyl-D-erythritol 2,4-cyclodiphosphate synthase [Nitrospinae bacterium]|nr:2-C-methyl-D-erythritol 2,4-cyclodiphosphate synthase [Nitrospinota bacterium]